MKRSYWLRISVGLILWTIVIGLFLIIYNPLGPRLPTVVPAAPQISSNPSVDYPPTAPSPTGLGVPSSLSATPDVISPAPTNTLTPTEICGNSGAMTFLIIGENPFVDSTLYGANTIRLAKFDFGRRQIHVLSLPSEMWVNTPALRSQGISRTKLSLVYFEGKHRAPGSDQAKMGVAAGILAQTLEDNFGYFPDHYIVIKANSFPDMIDAVGGIDLTLPIAVDGRPQGKGYYPAGAQHLDGDKVLDLVLILQSGDAEASSEWKKYELPTQVLQAVDRALNLPKNSIKIPSLMDIFAKVVLTDLSIKNILDLTCLVNYQDILVKMDSIGSGMLTGGSGQDLNPRVDLLSKFISDSVGK